MLDQDSNGQFYGLTIDLGITGAYIGDLAMTVYIYTETFYCRVTYVLGLCATACICNSRSC